MSLAALLLALAVAGSTITGDLGGYLERSAASEFAGEQVVSCDTPDGDRRSLFEIAQSGGVVAAWVSDDGEAPIVTVGPGSSAVIEGGTVEATLVEGTAMGDDDAYTVGEETPTTFLGRPALEVAFRRDGTERVRLTIDDATGAVLRTRVYTGAGDLYCDRRLVSFETEGVVLPIEGTAAVDQGAAEPIDPPSELPAAVDGFRLLDTYQLEEGTLSYYSDGFFSVGVVITDRPVLPDDAVPFELAGGHYLRVFGPGTVTVTWMAEAGNMALVGDLPPDLVESFLGGLPAPTRPGFFGRIWNSLFG